jgi:hypothetical protein
MLEKKWLIAADLKTALCNLHRPFEFIIKNPESAGKKRVLTTFDTLE